MFGLETLDVLIGLVTVYLTFGIACTAIVEAIAAWFSLRSRNLEAAMQEFLAGNLAPGTKFVDTFYAHPLVQALSQGSDGRPSYIPPEVVGQVVEALLTARAAGGSLANAIDALPGTPADNRIKGLLQALVTQAKEDSSAFRKAVETHFDMVMDRASGWFKRRQVAIGLIVSALLVVAANVDTVALAVSLASSPAARERLVGMAEERLQAAKGAESAAEAQVGAGKGEATSPSAQSSQPSQKALEQAKQQSKAALTVVDQAKADLQAAGLGIGWKAWPAGGEWPTKIAGLLVSIFAVSLGAPFWFDVLQSFMQVRASGISPREKAQQDGTTPAS